MAYLVSQLWMYLLVAAAIGLVLGWIIWGWFGRRRLAELYMLHDKRRLGLERAFEADKITLEEDRAAAYLARDEALKTKASLIGEIEGERRSGTEARAEIDRLKKAATVTRGQLEERLAEMQRQLELERSTTEEAKGAVDAIREDMGVQLREKQAVLSDSQDATRTLRTKLSKLETEAKQSRDELERRLDQERKANAALQAERQKDRRELSETKDAIDALRANMNSQAHAERAQASGAKNAVAEAKRELKEVRAELDLLKATATSESARAGKTEGERIRQAMQRELDDERRARAAAEADRSRITDGGAFDQKLDESRQRESGLESEVARLHGLLSQRDTAATKAKQPAFKTDAPRPAALYEHRPDTVDDLKEIKGIGPVMERILNEKGCYHFKQLASFSKRDIEWISAAIDSFPDRIERDDWVGQAGSLYREKYGRSQAAGNVRTLETTS